MFKQNLVIGAAMVFAAPVWAQSVGGGIGQPDPFTTSIGQGVAGSSRPSQTQAAVGPTSAAPVDPLTTGPAASPASAPGPASRAPTVTQFGIFALTTAATVGSIYDDNVFATHGTRKSDVAFFARPELSLAASGADYALQGSAFVEGRKYVHYDSEDQLNGGAGFAGLYQPDPNTQLRGHVQYLHGHEERGTGDSVFTILDRPVSFDQVDGAVAVNKTYGDWWTSAGFSTLGVLYQNSTIGGVPVDQTFRDAVIPAVTLREGHVIAPLTSVFVDWTGNMRQFRYEPLSSRGFRAVAGLLLEPGAGARVKGEVFGGYMVQSYDGAGLLRVATPTYGVSLGFLVTDHATLTLDGRREAKESGLFGGVSLIESSAGARLDYEVMPNLIASAGATLLIDEFRGAPRSERYVSPLASLKYSLTRTLTVGIDYRLLDFQSSGAVAATDNFRRNVVLGSLNMRF